MTVTNPRISTKFRNQTYEPEGSMHPNSVDLGHKGYCRANVYTARPKSNLGIKRVPLLV